MPLIVYIESDGTRHDIDVENDMNLMEGATLNMVPGVDGICGGICSCATCHCYIDETWAAKIPVKEPGEVLMLQNANPDYLKASSRLGCQIIVSAELEGMEVHLPPEQG